MPGTQYHFRYLKALLSYRTCISSSALSSSLTFEEEEEEEEEEEMERSMRVFSTVFVVLLLLVATEMGPMVAEARTCESQSHRFKGPCVRKSNCASVCQTEGFHGGQCRGFRRRCFCTKHC